VRMGILSAYAASRALAQQFAGVALYTIPTLDKTKETLISPIRFQLAPIGR